MRTHSITFAALLALLLVSPVFSWGEVGHLLVTQITEYDLKARGYGDVLQKATDIILRAKEMSPKMTWTFEGGSIYADELKFVQKIDVFDEMHYFDMILNPNGVTIRQDAEKPNALSFIYKAIDSFKAKKNNQYTWTDTFILRMLTHIVGDMHQPLHMTTLYSEEFPTGDQGGNKFKIHYVNKTLLEAEKLGLPTNLHAYWDQGAGIFPSFPTRPLPQDNQTWIKNYAQEMYKNYTRDAFKEELLEKNVTRWGKAVFNISRDTVYPPLMNNAHTITPEYTATMYPIMLKMITLAGYRLSDILVDLFGSKHQITDPRVQLVTHHMARPQGFLPEKLRQAQAQARN